jgi:hypothetical protein
MSKYNHLAHFSTAIAREGVAIPFEGHFNGESHCSLKTNINAQVTLRADFDDNDETAIVFYFTFVDSVPAHVIDGALALCGKFGVSEKITEKRVVMYVDSPLVAARLMARMYSLLSAFY